MTGHFGKNHLGDRDDMLPTAHGMDVFYGNLYHLNAEEEPENADYPKDLPPIVEGDGKHGFWSLTMYNPAHFFYPNALKRYALGTKNKTLKYNADGSLTIYLGHR
jgi:arylsulfatase A-like enzyme